MRTIFMNIDQRIAKGILSLLFILLITLPTVLSAHFEKHPVFIENKGQIRDSKNQVKQEVRFYLESKNMEVFLLEDGITYQIHQAGIGNEPNAPLELFRVDMRLIGAQLNSEYSMESADTEVRNDYRKGITNIRAFRKVVYKEVYPKIDWVIYSREDGFKHEFIVHPGGDLRDIQMRYDHQDEIQISNGDLIVSTQLGNIREEAPISSQLGRAVASSYILNENIVSFSLGSYDTTADLVVDPGISWATYYGGSGMEEQGTCATDRFGNVYLAAYTNSVLTGAIASVGGYQQIMGGVQDAFLVKFDSTGQRVWSTYFGGEGVESNVEVETDLFGNVYLSGTTTSHTGISTALAHKTTIGSGSQLDIFLAKFDSTGQLQWATYYGGESAETNPSLTTDSEGNVILVGSTYSATGIAGLGHQNSLFHNEISAFIAKFDSSGVRQWGTYLQSPIEFSRTRAISAVCDTADLIYIAGYADRDSLSTSGFTHTYKGQWDAYLASFSGSGSLLWCTYFGGEQSELDLYMDNDDFGNLYLFGSTGSASHIATGGLLDTITGTDNSYLAKFNSLGQKQWATYLPFQYVNFMGGITTMPNGNIVMAGYTADYSGFPFNGITNPLIPIIQYHQGGITEYDSSGHRIWAEHSGAFHINRIRGMASDNLGNLYVSGNSVQSRSDTLPYSTFQNYFGGDHDASLLKLNFNTTCQNADKPTVVASLDTACVGENVTLSVISGNLNNALDWYWFSQGCGNGFIQTGNSIQINLNSDAHIFVYGDGGCTQPGLCDTVQILVYPAIVNNILTASQTLCNSGVPNLITGSLPSGGISNYNYLWESSDLSQSWTNIVDATLVSYQPPFSTTPTLYRRLVTDNSLCSPQTSNEVLVLVYGPGSNTISSNQTLIPMASPSPLNGSNPGGNNLFQWQYSTDMLSWINISGATQSNYHPSADSITSWYRRIMYPGVCDSIFSNVIELLIRPGFLSVSPAQTVCEGSSIQLQVSSSNTVPVMFYIWSGPGFFDMNDIVVIPNANTYNSGLFTVTAYFMDGTNESNTVQVNVLGMVNNQISTNQTIQVNALPGLLVGNQPGYGFQIRWEESHDSIAWTSISGATNENYQAPQLNATRYYRRIVFPGVCDSISNVVRISVSSSYLSVNSPLYVCQRSAIYLNVQSSHTISVIQYSWVGPNGFSQIGQSPSISQAHLNHSGIYTVTATFSDGTQESITLTVNVQTRPTLSYSSPVCAGNSLHMSTQSISDVTYLWTAPNGFTSSTSSHQILDAQTSMSGNYQLLVTYPPGSCPNQNFSFSIVVNEVPSLSPSSNSPVCSGSPLFLNSGSVPSGISLLWAGPNGFNSTSNSPGISNAQALTHSGNYTLTGTIPGCPPVSVETQVVVNFNPRNAIFSSNQPVCEGGALHLSASNLLNAIYLWTGPDGFTSNSNVAIRNPASKTMNGIYTVTIQMPGCPSRTATISVFVNSALTLQASANSPVCTGGNLFLSASPLILNATYSWTGPSGFIASSATTSRSNMQAQHAGNYSVSVSSLCGILSTVVPVVVVPNSAGISISPSQTICAGSTLTLTGTPVSGATLSWSKPGFPTVNSNTLTIPVVDVSHQGNFTYNVTTPNCGTITKNVRVSVFDAAQVGGVVLSPVCVGSPLYMSANYVAGANYHWEAPDGFTSALQNPSRNRITILQGGIYTLTSTLPGCGSISLTFPVLVVSCREGSINNSLEELDTQALQSALDIQVYPNPFSQVIQYNSQEIEFELISILDAQGKVISIHQNPGKSGNIENLGSLTPGIYLLKFEYQGKSEFRKIVKY